MTTIKVSLTLEKIDLQAEDCQGLTDIEWVDEESEMSLVGSPFVDGKMTDEYPSNGRMYVLRNDGVYLVTRIREE